MPFRFGFGFLATSAVLLIGLAARSAPATPPPVLPVCPLPAVNTDGSDLRDPGPGLNYVATDGCVPQWGVDLYKPEWDEQGNESNPPYGGFLLPNAPYIQVGTLTMTPAQFTYGDGQDQTVTFQFDSSQVYRQPTAPCCGNPPYIYYQPTLRIGAYLNPYGQFEWTRRVRDASGVFGPWQRSSIVPAQQPFTLTLFDVCGMNQDTTFNFPPLTCHATLHWQYKPTQDMQVVFPVLYDVVAVANHRNLAGGSFGQGFLFVSASIAGAAPLSVSMTAGVSNGKVFSIDATVTNQSGGPLTGVAFTHPEGITTSAPGIVTAVDGPTPPLPASLDDGASAHTTFTFLVQAEGGVTLTAEAAGTDGASAVQTGSTQAAVQIGHRDVTPQELQQLYGDALLDTSQSAGEMLAAYQQRLGLIVSYGLGPQGTDTLPPWLNVSINQQVAIPPGTVLADIQGAKVSMARMLGLDDRALLWIPDDPTIWFSAYANFIGHVESSGQKVVADSFGSAVSGVQYAGEFYTKLASGDQAFRDYASRGVNDLVTTLGDKASDTLYVLGQMAKLARQDPGGGDLTNYEDPVLQDFQKKTTAAIDATLSTSGQKVLQLARKAKADPVGAAGDLGDVTGTAVVSTARDILLLQAGSAGVARLGAFIESTLPAAAAGTELTSGVAAVDAAAAPLAGAVSPAGQVVARQTLESLGEGTVITSTQMEELGGFYAADASKVQKIVTDVNQQYGVNIEIQVRPGNPASLQYYKDGTGVPKPEWVKPKNTEWMDVVLGAPPDSLGKATVFKPVRPSPEVLAEYSPSQQATILSRLKTQEELYADATTPGGKFYQLIQDSKAAQGATVHVGFGAGAQDVTGLKYSSRPVAGSTDAFYIMDDAAGGKFVLSDADYQAVVDANTGAHLPAAKRGQIELEVMNRLRNETVSFGGHGWSHSGFDLPSKYSKPFVQFVTESSSPAAARRTLEWFVRKGSFPDWLQKLSDGLAAKLGRAPTNAELVDLLLETFRPGSFVVKFNGTNVRVGYAAGIR